MYLYIYMHVSICLFTSICLSMYVSIYMYIYVSIYIYLCVYLSTYTHLFATGPPRMRDHLCRGAVVVRPELAPRLSSGLAPGGARMCCTARPLPSGEGMRLGVWVRPDRPGCACIPPHPCMPARV